MRKIFMTTAALAALLGGASAQAGTFLNDVGINGIIVNGRNMQGLSENGTFLNGTFLNGLRQNGTAEASATVLLQGITLPGGATLNALVR